jgi:hypothetical protein
MAEVTGWRNSKENPAPLGRGAGSVFTIRPELSPDRVCLVSAAATRSDFGLLARCLGLRRHGW